LHTMAQPAARAGPALRVIIAEGKVPRGDRGDHAHRLAQHRMRLSAWCPGMMSPYRRLPSSANHSMNDAA